MSKAKVIHEDDHVKIFDVWGRYIKCWKDSRVSEFALKDQPGDLEWIKMIDMRNYEMTFVNDVAIFTNPKNSDIKYWDGKGLMEGE